MGGGDTVLFSSVFMEEATGNRPEMLVTTAARASNGEAIGTIVFVVDMGPLYTLIQDTAGLGSTGEVLVGTRSGNDVVYLNPLRHDPGAALKRRIHIGEAVGLPIQSGVAGQTGVGQSIDYRGQKVIAAWRYLPSLGWGLVAKIDSREEFAVVTRLQHLLIMILAITLIVAGVIIFSITQSIAAPIQALSRGVERVGSGNLDYKVGNTLKDEIGQLSRSFDKMTHDLKAITASRDDLNHEIVEREQAEASLRTTAEDLKRSNSDLEQFAYVASHDLQEPLRAVAGFMGLLKKQYAAALDAPAREYIELAVEGAERMQTLIHDLLTYSRVGTKGGAFVPMRMQDALDAALSNLTLAIDESKASITGDSLPGVQADLSQMTQLLQNLVGNAIKFSGGRRPEVHISAEHRDGHWLVSVRDNGIGIEPQYFERIFLIFQRLHSRSQYQGTGIGLAVCKRIVERHGGAIWVESTPDHGATFSFTIPDRGAYQ
jgi:signal transduction histidine kinase